jgi:hypothetical protein
VLVLASAALSEVSASRLYPGFRRGQHLNQRSLGERVSLFEEVNFDNFAGEREGYKYCLSCRCTFGLMSQPSATIDCFFNL